MNSLKFNAFLKSNLACREGLAYTADKSLQEFWDQSSRGDWMLWLCKKANLDLRKLTLAKARCAKLVIHLMKDQRSIDAVYAAEKFGLGEIERPELDAAAAAAYAAADAYAYADADADAYAAAAAAYAAADAYAYAAARKDMLNKCAIEIRKVVTVEDIINSIKD